MGQLSFGEAEYSANKCLRRREAFLQRMDGLILWTELKSRIAPRDAKGTPFPLSVMLRVQGLHWSF